MRAATGCLLLGVFLCACFALPLGVPALLVALSLQDPPGEAGARLSVLLTYAFFGFIGGVCLLRRVIRVVLTLEQRLSEKRT